MPLTEVAPLAGAWIETWLIKQAPTRDRVAPLAGAWIETHNTGSLQHYLQSHPSRVRGLKHVYIG